MTESRLNSFVIFYNLDIFSMASFKIDAVERDKVCVSNATAAIRAFNGRFINRFFVGYVGDFLNLS